jgi:hypothetical protein
VVFVRRRLVVLVGRRLMDMGFVVFVRRQPVVFVGSRLIGIGRRCFVVLVRRRLIGTIGSGNCVVFTEKLFLHFLRLRRGLFDLSWGGGLAFDFGAEKICFGDVLMMLGLDNLDLLWDRRNAASRRC